MGSCFGAQGAASTHRSPQNSRSFSAVTSQDPGQSFCNSALYRPAAAAQQAENEGGRALKIRVPAPAMLVLPFTPPHHLIQGQGEDWGMLPERRGQDSEHNRNSSCLVLH